MHISNSFLGETELWAQVEREDDRRARALAVAAVFTDRRQAVRERAVNLTANRGLGPALGTIARSWRLWRVRSRRLGGYLQRLSGLPPQQLSDAGLARFIFGHTSYAVHAAPVHGAHCETPSPGERELWEALDRLIVECHRQKLQPALAFTVAQHVRGRLRGLMREGKWS